MSVWSGLLDPPRHLLFNIPNHNTVNTHTLVQPFRSIMASLDILHRCWSLCTLALSAVDRHKTYYPQLTENAVYLPEPPPNPHQQRHLWGITIVVDFYRWQSHPLYIKCYEREQWRHRLITLLSHLDIINYKIYLLKLNFFNRSDLFAMFRLAF